MSNVCGGENIKSENNYLLSSVKNALLILNSFTVDHPEWGIRELARHLELSHSSIQRIIFTLASEGYIAKNPTTRKYRLGVRVLGFNNVITKNLEIHAEAFPVLQDLVQKTGETAHIGILEDINLVYLHKVEPERPIRVFTEIGTQAPCYCIAGGKAILAFQDDKTIEKVIQSGLKPYTEKTITDPEILWEHLKEIAQQGYAVSHGEYLKEGEIISIAAPIYDYTGRVFASLSLIGIARRITDNEFLNNITRVKKAAKKISENLGYLGAPL